MIIDPIILTLWITTDAEKLIESLREFYPDVKWTVTAFDANGEPLTRAATVTVKIMPNFFTECSAIIAAHTNEPERNVSSRVRNVMAKNLQHGMRVEFPNGEIGELNQWWFDKGVIGIGAPGGLTMELEAGSKVRVHP